MALPDSFLFGRREMIVALTASQHTPAVYAYRAFVTDGGLIVYGIDRIELFRRAASYVDRILKGAKPADPATDKVRVRDQSANGEDVGPRRACDAARPRRRGDRMMGRAKLKALRSLVTKP